MIKVLLFDFDGTIADSFDTMQDVFYEITGKERIKDAARIARLRQLPLRKTIKELQIRSWQVPGLLVRGRAQLTKHIDDIEVFPGMAHTIRELHADGYQLYVMSSNSVQNVQQFLAHHNLDTFFTRIYGNIGLFHKASAIRKVLRSSRFTPQECAYIGDEARDIDGATKAGVFMISVSWGYNDEQLLREHHPDAMVKIPKEIIAVLREKNQG